MEEQSPDDKPIEDQQSLDSKSINPILLVVNIIILVLYSFAALFHDVTSQNRDDPKWMARMLFVVIGHTSLLAILGWLCWRVENKQVANAYFISSFFVALLGFLVYFAMLSISGK